MKDFDDTVGRCVLCKHLIPKDELALMQYSWVPVHRKCKDKMMYEASLI